MTGIKIASGVLLASGTGAATMAQLDPKQIADGGRILAGMTAEQILGTLCILCILCVCYMLYKFFAVLLPILTEATAAIREVRDVIGKCKGKDS